MQPPCGSFDYSYNPDTAQMTTATTPEGNNLIYRYDGDLAIGESWAGEISGDVDAQLNNNLVPDSITVNKANPVNYRYDNDLLLTHAGDMSISRGHAAGLLTRTSLGSVHTYQSYNSFGELENLSANAADFENTYTRDKLGRIVSRSETLDGTTTVTGYTYDLAGRLVGVTEDGVETERYTFDANSNRITATINGVTTSATVDAQDRLLTYGNTGYDYTLNGELKTKTTNGVTSTFDYDVFGNLLKATLPGDITIDYVVDAQHRRIGKKVNGTLVQGFLYQDQLNPIAELDGDNNVVSRFVYGTRPNVPDYLIKGGKTYRIIADHLGSPRLVVDVTTGAIVQRMDFDTFGNITQDTNPGFQPFGFAGGIYDHHTELTRFGARDYDASTGRWTAKDPIGFAGGDSNLYGYVAVDPVNFVDPSGLEGEGIKDAEKGWIAIVKEWFGSGSVESGVTAAATTGSKGASSAVPIAGIGAALLDPNSASGFLSIKANQLLRKCKNKGGCPSPGGEILLRQCLGNKDMRPFVEYIREELSQ